MLSGCELVVTTSSREALQVLQSHGHCFDAIVSDVMMPELSGPELYAHCFRSSPDLAARFVFASGDPLVAKQMIAQTVASLGTTRAPVLLTKPTSRQVLLAAVAAAAAGSAHESGTYVLGEQSSTQDEGKGVRGSRY